MLKLDKIISKLLDKNPIFSCSNGKLFLTQHGIVLRTNFAEFYLLSEEEREAFIQSNDNSKPKQKGQRLLG